jgi:endo-1,4-beta-xylanase
MKTLLLFLMLSTGLASSAVAADKNSDNETLRQYADQLGFRVASKVRARNWEEDAEGRRILAREFNGTIVMAMMHTVENQPGRFNFRTMDRVIEFAKDHKMKIWGSALIYRKDSLPAWMQDRPKRQWNPRELDDIMKKHIQTVVRHGGDAFYAWGVVNEPNNRNEPWESAFGKEEYISKAFRYAREATSVPLVLNESFGLDGVNRAKTDDFFALIKRLKSRGVPIDGAGIEMHLEAQQLRTSYLQEFRYWLDQARDAGVQVYITEMDVYQGPAGAVPDAFENQKKIYHDVTAACLADSNCKALNIWDLVDRDTWLVDKKHNPRADAKPLLFDDNYQKKPAYYGVLQALKEAAAKH